MPATVAGFVFLAASICPGFWWVRVVEERKPRRERTQLLEAAELVSVGGLATSLALLATLLVAEHTQIINAPSLFTDPRRYMSNHPTLVLGVVLAVLVIANLGAWGAANLIYSKHTRAIRFGESATFLVAVSKRPLGSRTYLRVVQHDGTVIRGPYLGTTVEAGPPESQEVVLATRDSYAVEVKSPVGKAFEPAPAHCVVVNGSTIAATYAVYYTPRRTARIHAGTH